jgi:hypothetical protein
MSAAQHSAPTRSPRAPFRTPRRLSALCASLPPKGRVILCPRICRPCPPRRAFVFIILINPFSHNSSIFTSIQIPRECGVSLHFHSSLATRHSPLFRLNSFPCHTSKKCTRNPFICHTSKIALPQVLSLPHIRKTGAWGGGGLWLTWLASLNHRGAALQRLRALLN